jgi:hypothetical protein
MSYKAYKSGRVCQAVQDGNREFISLLACISAIGHSVASSVPVNRNTDRNYGPYCTVRIGGRTVLPLKLRRRTVQLICTDRNTVRIAV